VSGLSVREEDREVNERIRAKSEEESSDQKSLKGAGTVSGRVNSGCIIQAMQFSRG
jgi:hypothetical protein